MPNSTKPRETQIEDLIQRWREREERMTGMTANSATRLCRTELEALLREEARPSDVERYLMDIWCSLDLVVKARVMAQFPSGLDPVIQVLRAPKGGEE